VEVMRKGRLAAVAALLLVTAMSAGAIVALQQGEPKDIPADYWSKRIEACQDKTLVDTAAVLDHTYDCLKDAIWEAVTSNSFPQFAQAAEPIMANDVRYEYVCHIPGHDLGRNIIEHYDYDWRTAILAMSYDLCGGGFVHGIYDVWGAEKHPIEDWVKVGDYCWEAIQIRYSACGDAIGHSGYESEGQNLEAAMLICDAQRQEMIQTPCSNGAYMQANFPQSSKLKAERDPVIKDPSEWGNFVTFCDNVPFKSFGAKAGCYYGAGWVMGNNIYFMLQQMRTADFDEFKSTPEMDAKVLELIDIAVDACNTMDMDIQDVRNGCIYIMLARMPLFYYMDTPKFEEFCRKSVEGLPEQMYLECLASGHEHITPTEMRRLIDKHEGLEPLMKRRGLSIPPPGA
jgi:hypothetical protein